MEFDAFLVKLSNPARRALENEEINSFEKLAALSKKELRKFHGIGPKSLPIIEYSLNGNGIKLRD